MARTRFILVIASLCLFSPSIGSSQEGSKQLWEGVLDVGAAKIKLNFEITRGADGEFTGKMISVDQGNAVVPLSKIEVSDGQVLIEASSVGARFEGKVLEDGKKAAGTWSQGGSSWDFEIQRVDAFVEARHVESWQGTLLAGTQSFDFQLRIFEEADGTRSGKLDSFNENLIGLPIELTVTEQELVFEVKISAAKYESKYSEDRIELEGKWLQSGLEFPLTFKKIDLEKTRVKGSTNRPQNPKPPFPYDQEQVTYQNAADNATLAGTLTIPQGDGPFPAVILISGSGLQDRDETIFEHKPFWVIADHLTRLGIAVLRYDERSVGESTGDVANVTSEGFARDVEAGIDFLTKQPRIDPQKIGLIGHSEGGLIAPMLAAKRSDIAVIVLLAGPGVDGGLIVMSQSRAMAEVAGAPGEIVEAQDDMLSRLVEEIKQHEKPLEDAFVDEVVAEFNAKIPEDEKDSPQVAGLRQSLERLNNDWTRFFIRHDPRPPLQQVACPVLALNGKKDLQVLVDLNIDAIEEALETGRCEDFEVHKLDDLNHLFQTTSGTGLVTEYGQIEETFSPAALELMSKWLVERLR